MKLRNKKTGEIVIVSVTRAVSGVDFDCGQTLAELNEEWEDAPEEPEEDGFDHIINLVEAYSTADDKFYPKEIVEKLKAWKRLKDEYDFKFTGWKRDEQFRGDFIITAQDWNTSDDKLLDLLFGGEE